MNNVIVIIPPKFKPEPKDCPVCKKAFSSVEDVLNYRKWECCKNCDIVYRYPNREKWEEGWRPDN
tara:strand:+ start:1437 stop:1631 length:195 start_codon:yes stop_codon:yes gene_type:complete